VMDPLPSDYGQTIDALRAELTRVERERDSYRKDAEELLAVIHRDGGHHTIDVGFTTSCGDATDRYCERIAEIEELHETIAVLRDVALALGFDPGKI